MLVAFLVNMLGCVIIGNILDKFGVHGWPVYLVCFVAVMMTTCGYAEGLYSSRKELGR